MHKTMDSALLFQSSQGVPLRTIAAQHGCSVGEILDRLLTIADKYIAEGKTVAETARLTGLWKAYLEKRI
jgi:chromosome segregation and condensation protein ScpB